jgi:hypothetical protein
MGLNNFTTSTGAADFTDVNLDSANFPSGYTIDEDGGDLVVRDTTGTVALRRVDGGNWSFAGNTVEANQLGTSSSPVDAVIQDLTVQGQATGPFSDGPKTRVSLTTNSSASVIPYDNADFGGGDYDFGTQEYTAPSSGLYQFSVLLTVNSGSGLLAVRIDKNGNIERAKDNDVSSGESVLATDLVQLSSGDTLQIRQTGSLSIKGDRRTSSFSIFKVL